MSRSLSCSSYACPPDAHLKRATREEEDEKEEGPGLHAFAQIIGRANGHKREESMKGRADLTIAFGSGLGYSSHWPEHAVSYGRPDAARPRATAVRTLS